MRSRFVARLARTKDCCILPDSMRHAKLISMKPDFDEHKTKLTETTVADYEFGLAVTSPSTDMAAKVAKWL